MFRMTGEVLSGILLTRNTSPVTSRFLAATSKPQYPSRPSGAPGGFRCLVALGVTLRR